MRRWADFSLLYLASCAGLASAAPVGPVLIGGQPWNQMVLAGASATFTATAIGTAPITYQWNKNGVPIGGATSAIYTTPPSSSADNGASFTVTVTNSVNSFTSHPAILTVTSTPVAPSIMTPPQYISVAQGSPASFYVVGTGTVPLAYQWSKDGLPISGATNASYTTPPTTIADNNSQFTVTVKNGAGSISSGTATLAVSSQIYGLGGFQPVFPDNPGDITGVRFRFIVTTNDSKALKIVFGSHRFTNQASNITYLAETNVYSGSQTFADGGCTTWPLLGSYTEATASLRNATPDYIYASGQRPAVGSSIDTSDPDNWPVQTYLVDNISNLWKSDSISQVSLNNKEVLVTIERGGTLIDVSNFLRCGLPMLSTSYRLWKITTQVTGRGAVFNQIILPDGDGRYLAFYETMNFYSEFLNGPGTFSLQYWDFAYLRESNPVWTAISRFTTSNNYDGSGQDFGARVVSVNGQDRVEFSNVPGNSYLPGNLPFAIAPATAATTCAYSLSSGGAAFTAQGGNGTVTITTPPGCAWSVGNVPAWITLTTPASGVGSGSVSFQVLPNSGADQSGSFTVAGQTFTIEQEAASIPGLSFVGSMPHVPAEADWNTTFTFVNKGMAPAIARTNLFARDGTALTMPLTLPQQPALGGPLLGATLDQTIAPNASFVMGAAGLANSQTQEGSAQLLANGNVDGFAIFHFNPNNQEAVVPMETRNAASYLLAFDNTNGVLTGVALANVSASMANIPVTIRDDTGTLVTTGSIVLAGSGHTSFVLSTQFPVTANIRGTIEFDTPGFGSATPGQISALGIRYTPGPVGGTTTTIPALANVTGPGSGGILLGPAVSRLAHLAAGNGWETTFVLVNISGAASQAHLKFFDASGNPLPLPLSFPQAGGGPSTTSATLDRTIAAGASLWVRVTLPAGAAYEEGSAQLSSDGNIGGFEIFRFDPNGQEAVVPLENRNASSYIVAFDNTGGTATGIALSTASLPTAVQIPVTLRDDTGAQLGTGGFVLLDSNGHTSFVLATRFPQTAGRRGTIEFATPTGAQIGVLGIRTPPALTFTTLPALAQ